MDLFTLLWVGWIGAFAAIEGAALMRRRANAETLSGKVWTWFGIKGKPAGYRARRFALLTFLAWLVAHFLTGGWV